MAAKKGGLGKGLDSLLVNKVNADHSSDSTIVKEKSTTTKKKSTKKETPDTMVKLSLVEPNREQPRKHFDEDGLLELAESIKQYGILQPLLVQEKSGYYEIIAGERRWRAAKLAGLKEIPVIVRNLTEQQIVEISLIENIQREDLNPIEEAQAFRRLMEEFHMKQDEIADRVSKSRTAVTNSMRLLKLSKQVQQMVIDGMLTTGHARALLAIEDPEELKKKIVEKELFSYEDLEEYKSLSQIIDFVYKKKIRVNIIQPTILYNYPAVLIPLARRNDEDNRIIDVFQIVACGTELCKAYSELVNPEIQRQNFEEQAKAKQQGDDETMELDEGFMLAMEQGMPPISGLGFGIDRLMMLIYNQDSIRDVVLFPTMKPVSKENE